MKKEMLINVLQPEECRIAIIEDGVLEELYVERTSHESYTGNIYKGKIVNLEPAIQAAFVDFSVGRNGFLHVSDVEPQYFDRLEGPHPEAESGPRDRDRDRKRDPRRGRTDRRPPAPRPDPLDPLPPSSPPPPRMEERPRERGRERDRDRDRDRGRERERPDQSIKGRRDRSEPPPRRFGEGLVEPAEVYPEPDLPIEPPITHHESPFETHHEPAQSEPLAADASAWPAHSQHAWDDELSWPGGHEPEPEPETTSTRDPFGGLEDEPPTRGFRPIEPLEADLPPSRTQRSRGPNAPGRPGDGERGRYGPAPSSPPPADEWPPSGAASRQGDIDPSSGREPRRGRGRGRSGPPQGRPRPAPPLDRDDPLLPETEPILEREEFGREPEHDEFPRSAEPPRRRGGRAAIRSRGGDWEGPREAPPRGDVVPDRPARALPPAGEFDADRRRPHGYERPAELEGRRSPATPEPPRDRELPKPHDRAGEPGYVPRRARQRTGDPLFGADLYSHGSEWPDRDPDAIAEGEVDPRLADVADDDEGAPFGDLAEGGPPGAARTEGRRRRRRRGRRRERPKTEPSGAVPAEDVDFDEFAPEVGPTRSYARGRAPSDDLLGDLDDLDLEDAAGAPSEHFDRDEFGSEEIAVAPVEEEIDAELEQEIRREIEEIEELEREMGLRGPADARPRRGEETGRGGRSSRGRGLVKPPIQEIFRRGDEVLVQVIKESIGTKGPTLSTYISIPGRYLVLMPGLNRVGVSRKIVDEGQRKKLREIMHELNPPKGLGFIVRTAGLERTKRELARDLAYLLRLWKVILRRIKKTKGPTPIYQESDMIIRTIRDIFNSEIDTIWIDEPSAFERAQDFLKVVMPRFVNRLKLYDEKVPLFHKYGIEDEIAKIQRRHVPLPEGGSIVIDQTEALVAIDVNSGNFRVEDDAERTAYEMNLRAAKEIARQLRLRDLGGVIVNDFIDMREERHRRGVERALRDAIKRDRARTKVLRMSAFGLIEMTRQRIRPSLKRSVYEDCHHCAGAGVIKTAESMAIDVMRLVALATHREEIRRMAISVHPSVAAYLSNRKRKDIARLETECSMAIQISFEPNSPAEHLKIECYDANGNEVRLIPAPHSHHHHKRGH